MKQIFFAALFFIFSTAVFAQIENHVQWQSNLSKQAASIDEEVELIFKATIDENWYLYSSDFDPDLGPMLTEFFFEENNSYALVGGIEPINPSKKYDSLIWEGEYTYFKKKGEFRQKVKVLSGDFAINVTVRGQTCSDIDGKCILFEENFVFNKLKINPPLAENTTLKEQDVVESNSLEDNEIVENDTLEEQGVVEMMDEAIDSVDGVIDNIKGQEEIITSTSNENNQTEKEISSTFNEVEQDLSTLKKTASKKESQLADITPKTNKEPKESLLMFMLAAFLGGLAAILTPCVFPMIPMTVTFFTNNTGKGGAIIYGISIILIYSIFGVLLALIFGATIGNILSTHWLPNLIFFAVFLFFALSFFGMFEIVIPSKLVNKVDQQVDRGGILGPFFIALTLVLVSFSCTGPIVGSILVASAGGEILKPIAGMFAFSLAFALPFSVFAFFPSLMQKLPKSGGWLNSVKVTMGFIELALAFKFLSMADQVYHWGILDREIYVAIWIAIALSMGLYFLGYIRLPHDSKMETVSVTRLLLAIASFAFVIYLIPGMFGAPLKALSGYLPPRTSHDFDLSIIATGNTVNTTNPNALVSNSNDEVIHQDKFILPHGLTGYFDYQQGLKVAKKLNKPILLDFTGHACVNCRKMEDYVWGEKPVLQRLKNDYVLISLYVDDRTKVDENAWITSEYDGKVKKTIGQINADLQISKFNNNAQPYYVLLNHNEEVLVTPPIGYQPDVQQFAQYLDTGKSIFEKQQRGLVSENK
ncbi:MAG: LptF/LptG family permease [Bacteroidota bacterium]